jgi:REP element-mobilizing transposase RayT
MNKYNPKYHHRRSIRLKGYDYSQAGLYFITLCAQDRTNLFGKINEGEVILNTFGEIIKEEWGKTPEIRKNISLGEFIIMPNHFHAIIHIDYQIKPAGELQFTLTKFKSPSNNIGAIIRGFKGATTKRIKEIIRNNSRSTGELQFAPTAPTELIDLSKSIWQRDYWEHIIRNENAYNRITQYIINNPQKWENDKLNGGKGNIVMEPLAEYNTEDWMI